MEHSDRAYYVTEQVKLWIANDGEHVGQARKIASWCVEFDGAEGENGWRPLYQHLTHIIRRARPGEAAWHVGQEMAPNDWPRVRWADVAAELQES